MAWSRKELEALIAEATVDAYDEDEQLTGFLTMIEDHLNLPFQTKVLGMQVTVERIDLNEASQLVAICSAHGARQAIGVLDLPLPRPAPEGAQWIAAYCRWATGR